MSQILIHYSQKLQLRTHFHACMTYIIVAFHYKTKLIYRDYYMAFFISYPISTQDSHTRSRAFGPRPDVGVLGWYGVWCENCYRYIYLSYIFLSDKFACLISYAASKARPPSAPNVVIWGFCLGKKAVSPTWPGYIGLLPEQKSRITHVTHYHTFCPPQEWYVLESRVSITYAKWIYFPVNVW